MFFLTFLQPLKFEEIYLKYVQAFFLDVYIKHFDAFTLKYVTLAAVAV